MRESREAEGESEAASVDDVCRETFVKRWRPERKDGDKSKSGGRPYQHDSHAKMIRNPSVNIDAKRHSPSTITRK